MGAVSFVGFKYNFSCFETFDNIWWRRMSQQHPKSEFTYYEIFPCISPPKPQPQPKQHEDPTVHSWPSTKLCVSTEAKVETLFRFSKKPPYKNSTEKGLQLSIQITVWFSIECKIAPIFTQDTVNLLPVLIQDVLKQSTSYQN